MAFSLRYDNATVGKIVIPAVSHTLQDLTYITESSDQLEVIYDSISSPHETYIDARVSDEASFWVIVYTTDKNSEVLYNKVFLATAESRTSDTVVFNLV